MKVADRLNSRETTWKELDNLIVQFESAGRRIRRRNPITTEQVLRLGELYRSACADLMLAEAHDLPRSTVDYLHSLVGRGHNAVYRAQGFRFGSWLKELFSEVPRRLRSDPMLPLAAAVFYGTMLFLGVACYFQPSLAVRIAGQDQIANMEQMYSTPPSQMARNDSAMAGFYIMHNASIGLQCYALGMTFGLGTLQVLFSNAKTIGALFGYMFQSPYASNFGTFVTAHGPFELTAIVFSGAAGLRLGWGLISTGGLTRPASLRREAQASLPTAGAAVFLFVLAAFLEGFVSASALPYYAKAALAIGSSLVLILYLTLGGRRRKAS